MGSVQQVKLYRFVPKQADKEAYMAEVEAEKRTSGYWLDPNGKVPSETFREVWEGYHIANPADLERLRIAESSVDAAFMALKHWRREQLRLEEAWQKASQYWMPDLQPDPTFIP